MIDPQQFMREVDGLLSDGRRAAALDHVFNVVEDALLAGDIEGPRGVLRAALSYVEKMPASVFYSLLIVTKPWRAQLAEERVLIAARVNTDDGRRML